MTVRIASAPVNLGVYSGVDTALVDREALLAGVAAAGYAGMELGPPGFLGTPREIRERFARHALAVVGAYVPLHLGGDRAALAADLESMRRTLDELASSDDPKALAILADAGAPELLLHPARPWHDRSLCLDDAGWERLGEGLSAAERLAADAGIRSTFHPHISTYVESPWEVERLLELSPISLTLDTGHFRLAGADPVDALTRFGERVAHVHLKDVRVDALERARAEARSDFETWWPDVCVPLATGDAGVRAFLAALLAREYDGWVVVEQDRAPLRDGSLADGLAADARNARWLSEALRQVLDGGEAAPAPGVAR